MILLKVFILPGLSLGCLSSYTGLITTRAILGLLEGPVFPSIVLYLSSFYTRKELSLRYGSHNYHSSADGLYIDLLELLYFSLLFRCVIILNEMSLAIKFPLSSLALFLGCLLLQLRT